MAITNTPRLGIERWSHGTDRHPPRAVWDAQQAILDDLVAIDRQYPRLADRPAAGVRGTYCWVEENGVLYRDDGAQWRPIVQFGGGAGAAVVVGGSGAEGTSARTARADHSHPLPLATASAHGGMSSADKKKLDGATSAATASTLAQRDSAGGAAFSAVTASSAPSTAAHLTRKDYVDGLVGGVHVPTMIPSGANLDAYTTSGVYVQTSHASAQAGTNYPTPHAGLLTVHAASSFVFQEYTATNLSPGLDRNSAWRRTRYNGSWGAWEQSPTARYVDEVAGAARFAGQLDGIDLNEVLDPGLYGLNAQANATTALNYPAEGIGGTLLVMRWAGASGDSRAVTQLYQGRGATARNIVWIRSKIAAGSSWSQWVQLANTDLATSSSAGLMPAADKALVDAATANATGSTLARRDSSGRVSVGTPEITAHAAPKGYVDGKATAAQSAAEATAAAALSPVKALTDAATASATGNALMRRDSSGRVSVSTPTSATHAATKSYVDAGDAAAQSNAEATAAAALAPVKTTVDNATANATANRLVLRDSAGRFKAAAPSATTDVANKSYVDAVDTKYAGIKSKVDASSNLASANLLVQRDGSGMFHVRVPVEGTHPTHKNYVDGEVQRLDGLFGELDDRTFDMQATLDALAYDSGARYVETTAIVGISATVTVHRVGSLVTVAVSDVSGNLSGTGSPFWTSVGSAANLPVGFRPPATLTDDRFRITAAGAVHARGPGSYGGDAYGAVFTFVVSGAPPASFTWGDPV